MQLVASEDHLGPPHRTVSAGTRRRFVVVSWADDPHSPRGERTLHLVEALRARGDVTRRGPALESRADGAARDADSPVTSLRSMPAVRRIRRSVRHGLVPRILIDPSEPRVLPDLLAWRPQADAAVLIGCPFSPLAHAAPRLVRRGVPYVVDVGDPWTIGQYRDDDARSRRSRAAERWVWGHAAGGIVTTSGQAETLRNQFPELPVLVRPNGFNDVDIDAADPDARRPKVRTELRLVHYGHVYEARLDLQPLMARLAASGYWQRIVLGQHGHDWTGALERLANVAEVVPRPVAPWPTVVRGASHYDAALVIGNRSAAQLPSKAVQYLTLPIPRIALVAHRDDALATYVRDKPGWLVVSGDDDDAPDRVRQFVERPWTRADLAPVRHESWTAVERTLSEFILRVTRTGEER